MDWKKHLEKHPIQKKEKNSKNRSEITACEQKTTSKTANFCSNTIYSLCFKIRPKNFTPRIPSRFRSCRRDQNHYSSLTSKIMKMCEEISKTHRRIPEATRSVETSPKKPKFQLKPLPFCIKTLTHYLFSSDLKIGEI